MTEQERRLREAEVRARDALDKAEAQGIHDNALYYAWAGAHNDLFNYLMESEGLG